MLVKERESWFSLLPVAGRSEGSRAIVSAQVDSRVRRGGVGDRAGQS